MPEFQKATWDTETINDCRTILQLALKEDLATAGDITTLSCGIHGGASGAEIVSREQGVLCGQLACELLFDEFARESNVTWLAKDGDEISPLQTLAKIEGNSSEILRLERTALNVVGRLCGISSLTRLYVDKVSGTKARVYDTRKTTPGWRRLEKYAVACGGGANHRMGLHDAVLVKDNHLWLLNNVQGLQTDLPDLVPRIRRWINDNFDDLPGGKSTIVEIEVDTLDQFAELLPTSPDIILLDNMNVDSLSDAVSMRNQSGSACSVGSFWRNCHRYNRCNCCDRSRSNQRWRTNSFSCQFRYRARLEKSLTMENPDLDLK